MVGKRNIFYKVDAGIQGVNAILSSCLKMI